MKNTHKIVVGTVATGENDVNGQPTWFVNVFAEVDGNQYGADVYFDAVGTILSGDYCGNEDTLVADWIDGMGIVRNGYATEAEVVAVAKESGRIKPN